MVKGKIMEYSESQKRHAIRRAYQRYHLVLNNEKFEKLLTLTKQGFASTVLIQTNNTSIKTIEFEGLKLFFVFDKKNQMIVTFLNFDAVRRYCGNIQERKQKQKTKDNLVIAQGTVARLVWWDDKRKIALVLSESGKSEKVLSYEYINFFPPEKEINSLLIKEKNKQNQKLHINKLAKTKFGLGTVLANIGGKLRIKLMETNKIIHLKHSDVEFIGMK